MILGDLAWRIAAALATAVGSGYGGRGGMEPARLVGTGEARRLRAARTSRGKVMIHRPAAAPVVAIRQRPVDRGLDAFRGAQLIVPFPTHSRTIAA